MPVEARIRGVQDGRLQGGEEEFTISYVARELDYMQGNVRSLIHPPKSKKGVASKREVSNGVKLKSRWKANEDGGIPCPMEDRGGCGNRILVLMTMFSEGWVSKLLSKAKEMDSGYESNDKSELSPHRSPCFTEDGEIDFGSNDNLRKTSSLENSVTDLKDVDVNHLRKTSSLENSGLPSCYRSRGSGCESLPIAFAKRSAFGCCDVFDLHSA